MNLKNQRRLAARVLKCSPYRVYLNPARASDIEEAITKADLKGLINEGAIQKKEVQSQSRGRARILAQKKSRGRRKGHGSRKGKATARTPRKKAWVTKIRSQRALLQHLRERGKIERETFRMLYLKSKGGFFRNVRHIRLYLDEQKLVKK